MDQQALFWAHVLDFIALCWLFVCWLGYSIFARKSARSSFCIASVLHHYRKQWMLQMLRRDNRISDASFLTNLERNTSFLASTAIFVIAGLVTTLAYVDKIHQIFVGLPFAQAGNTPFLLQLKIMLLLCIFAYTFFTLTWSMRQYGFCAVLLGAAPLDDELGTLGEQAERYAHYTAKVIDRAGHSYNYGLRAYYFSLAVLAWMLNTWLFILSVAVVVYILYNREFHSKTLQAMLFIADITLEDVKKTPSNKGA